MNYLSNYLSFNTRIFPSKLFFLFAFLSLTIESYELKFNSTPISSTLQNISLTFTLDPKEYLIKDSIFVVSDNPSITISDLKAEKKPKAIYSSQFSTLDNTIEGYENSAIFTATAGKPIDTQIDQANLIVTFRTTKQQAPYHKELTINFDDKNVLTESLSNQNTKRPTYSPSIEKGIVGQVTSKLGQLIAPWKNTLTSLFSTTGSRWVRYIVTFIIGVLLSLTPCLYPMIPVTVGIIQAAGSTSLFRNFIVSVCYTLGVATTFACFGLVAALGGSAFGQLQTSPWFVIPLVAILTYLGLAMFGLYEMYIPRFLQPKTTSTVKKGSPLSAFAFGLVSGSVASPCLSPGLALVLSFVIELSKTGSIFRYVESFALLFIFGIGSSIPLLLIGTFSNSLKVLPQAGMWMVEVKKLLGLMLLGMCFYYLQTIVPWHILVWLLSAALFALSIYYFATIKPYESKGIKAYKYIMGALFMVLFLRISIKGYEATHDYLYNQEDTDSEFWIKDYNQAREQAKTTHKYLFLDFGTQYCPSCKSLEKNVLLDPQVQPLLTSLYVPVKVDATNPQSEPYNTLKNHIQITGFPTIVIFDTENNTVIKKWAGSVPDIPEFIKELEKLSTAEQH